MNRSTICLLFYLMMCLNLASGNAVFAKRHLIKEPGQVNWRGPYQDGTSEETDLPNEWKPDGKNHLWSYDLHGRGTAVTYKNRVFAWGYYGEKEELVEALVCLDAKTGKKIWEKRFNDFISDIIYNRYSIGAPAIDPSTGLIYLMTSPGLAMCFDQKDKLQWQHSMMEEYGRLTFPNGRTGSPVVDGDLVIFRGITTNWGKQGPARDRFYAFNKKTGQLVWSSTPGVGPPYLKDSSYSTPYFETRRGLRLFYAGTGCGNIVCVNARTGEPIWRYQLAAGGVNSSPIKHMGKLIVIHGKENIDDSGRGRMVALNLRQAIEDALKWKQIQASKDPANASKPFVLSKEYELWRNDELSMFTSSPVVAKGRVYQVTAKGVLFAVDVENGKTIWKQKLGGDQLHASPLWAHDKLYIPMWNDGFYIIKDKGSKAEVLAHIEEKEIGKCIGSPSVYAGQIYLHTTNKLYCIGKKRFELAPLEFVAEVLQKGTEVVLEGGMGLADGVAGGVSKERLQIVPNEILMRPGQQQSFTIHAISTHGSKAIGSVNNVAWDSWIPPTAKVKSKMDAQFNESGVLLASTEARRSAGAYKATSKNGKISGTIRGRILPSPPYSEDFNSFELSHTSKEGLPFAYPPLAWIGARLKWEVVERDGSKVLAKTLDRILFQRSMVFIGHSDDHNYTMIADVMTDGNRRLMSTVGLINQRYLITLKGNWQQIEVSSNHERLKIAAPMKIKSKTWYRLKTRVDVKKNGSGVVRAKAWPRDEKEPEQWTIQVPIDRVHTNGSPGLYGFSPQSKFKVYIDNVKVEPSK